MGVKRRVELPLFRVVNNAVIGIMFSMESVMPPNGRTKGFTLIEVLVTIAIIGILATVLVSGVFNARKRTVDAAAESYARQVATWVAAADAGGEDVSGVSECTDPLLRREGASDTLPNGVTGCEISYAAGHWKVQATSQSGKVFSASY